MKQWLDGSECVTVGMETHFFFRHSTAAQGTDESHGEQKRSTMVSMRKHFRCTKLQTTGNIASA